jgi:hypothetical protein
MRLPLIFLCVALFSAVRSFAQSYELVYRTTPAGIELKWYQQELISRKELYVMRRENGGDWVNLTTTGIRKGGYKLSAAELASDPELKDYTRMADSPKKPEGFGLLLMTLKSFQSVTFSKYIGIYYLDAAIAPNTTYDYGLFERTGSEIREVAVLLNVHSTQVSNVLPVDSLAFHPLKRGAAFRWKPEPNRFYGVQIYRSQTADSIGQLITPDPILLSKIKDESGNEVWPEDFYSDERLQEKQTYYYTFVGLNFFSESLAASAQLKVRIKDETAPVPPAELTKQIFDKKIVLNWTQPESSDDLAGYHIYATAPNDTILQRFTSVPLATGTIRYEFEAGRYALYTLRVAAVDAEGNAGFSNEVFAETLDKIPPAAPIEVEIVPDTARLIVQWKPNPEADILGYKIYRSVKGDETALSLLTADYFSEARFIDSLPVNAINAFSYKVIAVDSSGNESALSAMATNVMIDITPPKAPFLKSVRLDAGREVTLSWVANTEADHRSYVIYRKNDSDSASIFKQLNLQPVPGDVIRFTDRSVDSKQVYSYYVQAVDARGNVSLPSNTVRFRMAPERTDNQLTVVLSKAKYDKMTNGIRLRWKSKPYSETARYMVFRKYAGGSFVPVSAMLETTRFTDTTVEKGVDVEYQVRIYEGVRNQKSEILQVKIPVKTKNK